MHIHKPALIPYLARFAVPRIEIKQTQGWYSCETGMWMLNTATGPCPAIECDNAEIELLTKTDVKRESDESGSTALGLVTKTRAEREKDDISFDYFDLELATKTRVKQERDDESLFGEFAHY